MADSGMLRGEFPSFLELLARISHLEEQCNAIARSLACLSRGHSDPERFGARPVSCLSFALDFALYGLAGRASDTLTDKKNPLRRKESDRMEPSGFEPLTPCMPCRCSTS